MIEPNGGLGQDGDTNDSNDLNFDWRDSFTDNPINMLSTPSEAASSQSWNPFQDQPDLLAFVPPSSRSQTSNSGNKQPRKRNRRPPIAATNAAPADDLNVSGSSDLAPTRIRRQYNCETCSFRTVNPREFLYHRRDSHSAKVKIVECPYCVYACQYFQKLQRHILLVHKMETMLGPPNQDMMDNMSSPNKAPSINHDASNDGLTADENPTQTDQLSDGDHKPHDDDLDMSDSHELQIQEDESIGDTIKKDVSEKHCCDSCPFVGTTKTQILYHKQFHRPNRTGHKCTQCTYTVDQEHILNKHMLVHSRNGVNPQEQITSSTSSTNANNGQVAQVRKRKRKSKIPDPNSIVLPMVTVSIRDHKVTVYQCRQCNLVNRNKAFVVAHEMTHNHGHNFVYKCCICPFTTRKRSVYKEHVVEHNTDPDSEEITKKVAATRPRKNQNVQAPRQPSISDMLEPSCELEDEDSDVNFSWQNNSVQVNHDEKPLQIAVPRVQQSKPRKRTKYPVTADEENGDLAPTRIRRQYNCEQCNFRTVNPREFLYHRRDAHGAKVKIVECPYCVYACQYLQKLQRHILLVHKMDTVLGAPKPGAVPKSSGIKRSSLMSAGTTPKNGNVHGSQGTPMQNSILKKPTPSDLEGDSSFEASLMVDEGHSGEDEDDFEQSALNGTMAASESDEVDHDVHNYSMSKPSKLGSMLMADIPRNNGKSPIQAASTSKLLHCAYCDFTHMESKSMVSHMSVHTGRRPYKCRRCSFTSNWKEVVTRHAKAKHDGSSLDVEQAFKFSVNKFMCRVIDETGQLGLVELNHDVQMMASDNDMDLDLESMTEEEREICDRQVSQLESGDMVIESNGNPLNKRANGKNRCDSCPFVGGTKTQLLYHKQFHRPNRPGLKCTHCTYTVGLQHLLNQHMRVHFRNGIVPNQGIQSATSPSNVNGQGQNQPRKRKRRSQVPDPSSIILPTSIVSTPEGKVTVYQCRQCNLVNRNKAFVVAHEMTHIHGHNFVYKCCICPFTTRKRSVYKEHVVEHNEDEDSDELARKVAAMKPRITITSVPVESPPPLYAPKSFANGHNNLSVKDNVTEHETELDFDYSLIDESKLSPAIVAKIEQHVQQLCLIEKAETQSYLIKLKQKTKSKFGFKCQQCPGCFLRVNTLKFHSLLHGYNGIVNCDKCNYSVDFVDNLKSHESLHYHSNSNPNSSNCINTYNHKCTRCPAAFSKPSRLEKHLTLHGSDSKWKCDHCDYAVPYAATLVKHKNVHHSNQQHVPEDDLDMPSETATPYESCSETGKDDESQIGPMTDSQDDKSDDIEDGEEGDGHNGEQDEHHGDKDGHDEDRDEETKSGIKENDEAEDDEVSRSRNGEEDEEEQVVEEEIEVDESYYLEPACELSAEEDSDELWPHN